MKKIIKNNSILKFDIIFPTNKKVKILKNYLHDILIKYSIDTGRISLADSIRNGFLLQTLPNLNELENDDYIMPILNDTEILLIINNPNSSNPYITIGRFYYNIDQDSEVESLDYVEKYFLLNDAKKKLIEKHFDSRNIPNDNLIISFNGNIQTEKFNRLNDIFFDNDFYTFKIFLNDEEKKDNSLLSKPYIANKRCYRFPIPEKGRPLIVKFG